MRTVLTRILTAFLAASTTLSVSATPQVMKKVSGKQMPGIEINAKAQSKPAKAQGKSRSLLTQMRTRHAQSTLSKSGLRSASSVKLPGKKNYVYSDARTPWFGHFLGGMAGKRCECCRTLYGSYPDRREL